MACIISTSQPTGLPSESLNSFGAYVVSMATFNLPERKTEFGRAARALGYIRVSMVADWDGFGAAAVHALTARATEKRIARSFNLPITITPPLKLLVGTQLLPHTANILLMEFLRVH
jgi:hypothetical protein